MTDSVTLLVVLNFTVETLSVKIVWNNPYSNDTKHLLNSG
jgi:hypothetical protein